MAKMVKFILASVLASVLVFGDSLPDLGKMSPQGIDVLTLKAMVAKKPKDLEPEIAIMVGNIYQNGMKELKVNPNIKKAKLYYQSGADRGVIIGNLLLANLAASEGNIKIYVNEMETIIRANDEKLSIPAGLQLSAFWVSKNNPKQSMETLLYLANVYDEPRAQFLVGWSIVSGEYVPHDMSERDGQGYLYQACHNPKITPEIQRQCDLYSK